jgi:hypothetical protein
MMMTASDVSAIAKPWEIQHKLAKRVADEFFDQVTISKKLFFSSSLTSGKKGGWKPTNLTSAHIRI